MPSPFARLIARLSIRPSRADRRRAARLAVEELEGREVPSAVVTIEPLGDATEGGAAGGFRLTRTGDTTNALYVGWSPSGTAAPYSDYQTSMSVVIPAGKATVDVSVTAVNDTVVESTETVTMTLNPGVDYQTGSPASATIAILDDDALPVVSAVGVTDATEEAVSGLFRFTRTGSTTAGLVASYYVQTVGPGYATPDVDYVALPMTVSFEPGASAVDVDVLAFEDYDREQSEIVTVAVQEGGGYIAAPGTAQVWIHDNLYAPVAADDGAYGTRWGHELTVTAAAGVLANDYDPDQTPLTAALVSGPGHGTLTLNADGSFVYTPDTKYVGSDSFTYRAVDTDGLVSDPAVVLLDVTNVRPVAMRDFYGVRHDQILAVTAPGVLRNDYDADGDTMTVALVGPSSPAEGGTVTVQGDGGIGFTPAANFLGEVVLTYVVTDGAEESEPATISIQVLGDRPVANADEYATAVDVQLTIPADGVLENDFSPEPGMTLSAVLESGPANGTLSLGGDGAFVYTPNPGFFGYDQFTYRASAAGLVSLQPAVAEIAVTRLGIAVDGADAKTKIGYVPINGNNDNGSKLLNTDQIPQSVGIPTLRDYASFSKLNEADPELKRVQITADPIFLPGIYTITLSASGTARIRLWEDAKKTRLLAGGVGNGGTFTLATLPREFWVEGVEMTSMSIDPGGVLVIWPDAAITVTYWRPTLVPGPTVVPLPVAFARADVIVTPVVQSFKVIPGIVQSLNVPIGAGGAMITGAMQAGDDIPPGGQAQAFAGAQMLGTVKTRAAPGGPLFVQIAGHGTTPPVTNGTSAKDTVGASSIVGGEEQTRKLVFVDNNQLPTDSKTNPERVYTQILDTGSRWPSDKGKGEPSAPDYLPTTITPTEDYTTTLVGLDFPGVGVGKLDIAANYNFAVGFQRMAIRYNFRLHLMWRYPGRNGGPSILFPLARLEWSVYFHGVRNAGTGLLVPEADAKVTVGGYTLDHTTPGVLARPDFNLQFSLR